MVGRNKKIPIERKRETRFDFVSLFCGKEEEKPFVNSKYCSKVREHYPITPIRYALISLLIILVADKRKEGENRYKFLLRIGGS